MRALLDQAAAIEHQDVVGADDGRQPVGDDQRGAVLATSSSASWISFSVWLSSALVASSRIRIGGALEDGAGDGDALLLAAGELEAPLAHHGAIAVGQARG